MSWFALVDCLLVMGVCYRGCLVVACVLHLLFVLIVFMFSFLLFSDMILLLLWIYIGV